MKTGRLFSGQYDNVLQSEILKTGMVWTNLRFTYCVRHLAPAEECYTFGLEQVIQEAKGKKAILLVGARCVSLFFNESVSDINGLVVTPKSYLKAKYLSPPILVATMNPASVSSGTVGEFRMAIQHFAKAYLKKGKS
jgi:hypothetical protein